MKCYVGIDPSTKTGVVKINEAGEVLAAMELTTTKTGPARMIWLVDEMMKWTFGATANCIEGFSHGSRGSGVDFQYGLGWYLRIRLFEQQSKYFEAAPSALKKFASGKGNTSKDNLVLPIYQRWGFEHPSNDVRDAFVLAQIARSYDTNITQTAFQSEVIKVIRKEMALQ